MCVAVGAVCVVRALSFLLTCIYLYILSIYPERWLYMYGAGILCLYPERWGK